MHSLRVSLIDHFLDFWARKKRINLGALGTDAYKKCERIESALALTFQLRRGRVLPSLIQIHREPLSFYRIILRKKLFSPPIPSLVGRLNFKRFHYNLMNFFSRGKGPVIKSHVLYAATSGEGNSLSNAFFSTKGPRSREGNGSAYLEVGSCYSGGSRCM